MELQSLPEIAEVLHHQRPVEPHIGAHRRDILRRRVGPRDQPRRIARQQMHEQEHEDD